MNEKVAKSSAVKPRCWRVIDDGPGPDCSEVVIAINYFVPGRPEAGFEHLASGLKIPYQLWETMPPPIGTEVGMTGADYVTRWVDDLQTAGRTIVGILGNCAGSSYAPAIADSISSWQGNAPHMILFDPELPTNLTLYWQFHELIASFERLLSDQEIEIAQAAGQQAMAGNEDIQALAAALAALFDEHGGLAFTRLGLDAKRRREMVALFSSYLSYLVAGSQVSVSGLSSWTAATAISSSTSTSGLNRLSEDERVRWVGREIRFDVEHTELLSSADVGRVVTELLS